MFTGKTNLSYDTPIHQLVWLSLAFQAGAINSGGFLACHRFVTHTTGFATLFGTEVARGDIATGLSLLSVPLFFLSGCMLAGFFVDRRIILGKRPFYSHVLFMMTFFMAVVTLVGVGQGFGHFGKTDFLDHEYSFLALLSITSGLQNAIITTAFGAIIRTTHLTGLTTDLGLGLVRVFFKIQGDHSREKEIKSNWMRVSIILYFIFGSLTAALIFMTSEFWGFLVPTTISFVLWLYSIYQNRKSPMDLNLNFHRKKAS